ncbi:membrane protein [Bacillus sp. LL01]|uniref:DMT family transporter n=1 Tax=Bacillus sp. LL01 TaxID=1665556 RepID=UPI00064CE3CA|nr:multidrug resistance efflux transporter family protein [Bacillus sp. LL01]KMJ57480.1 membrane protein [Bacillus sp. LL01]
MKAILIGILASMFFAVTFILNRSMELSGGSWLWSSSLRFFFMVPFLVVIVWMRGNLKQLLHEMRSNPVPWFIWSFTGFVLFYGPITFAAAYGPGWLVAGTWQLTIIAGVLLGPFFYKIVQGERVRERIPMRGLLISMIIFAGVLLIQTQQGSGLTLFMILYGILPVAVASCAYPLGNRKMMEVCGGRLDTFQRVLGMTLATIPVWLLVATSGYMTAGAPSQEQVIQTFIVAISSGVIATTLFFVATDMVRNSQEKLAAVEATQSTQVLFVLIGEVVLLSTPLPNGMGMFGLIIIIVGMLLHSFFTKKRVKPKQLAA